MKIQNVQSLAQVKINFMKNEDKIAELGSKAYYRVMRDGNMSIVCELVDGVNLMMAFSDNEACDMSAELKSTRVNIRVTPEQFEAMNANFHEIGNIGAIVQVAVDGNVEYGTLIANGIETESYTLYVSEVQAVEEVKIQRVGSIADKEGVVARMRAHKAANAAAREQAIQANRPMLQTKAAQQGAEVVTPAVFG